MKVKQMIKDSLGSANRRTRRFLQRRKWLKMLILGLTIPALTFLILPPELQALVLMKIKKILLKFQQNLQTENMTAAPVKQNKFSKLTMFLVATALVLTLVLTSRPTDEIDLRGNLGNLEISSVSDTPAAKQIVEIPNLEYGLEKGLLSIAGWFIETTLIIYGIFIGVN